MQDDSKPNHPNSDVATTNTNKPSDGPFIEDNVFCCSTPLDPIFMCNSCFIVPERRQVVQLYFGAYHGTITSPGCYCRSHLCTEFRTISTEVHTFDLKNTKVLDLSGSPLIVSGVITYEIVDARKAAIDVNDPHHFVRDQGPAVLKRVVSQFPYENSDSSLPSLRSETNTVADLMRAQLQQRVSTAGIRIDSFSINELSYAPEIAQAMLRRQQADALIAARRSIVQGAREIATDAVEYLGDAISPEHKSTLLSNLLIVLVGDKDVTPTLNVSPIT